MRMLSLPVVLLAPAFLLAEEPIRHRVLAQDNGRVAIVGTDAPFVDGAPQVKGLQASGFSASELADVERNNALTLLGRRK